jgi:hypothetical protein
MKRIVNAVLAATVFAATIAAQAAVASRSKAIVVETPADLPEVAQAATEAIYLHPAGNGSELLYLEQGQGSKLAILDVTDPAQIKSIGRVSIAANAPYDFVKETGPSAVLVRYRDHSGFAVIDLRHAEKPVLANAPQVAASGYVDELGQDALLLTPANFDVQNPHTAGVYQVVDFSRASNPVVLATVAGVKQSVSNDATGTLYLLGQDGLTAVRQTAIEREHAAEETEMREN